MIFTPRKALIALTAVVATSATFLVPTTSASAETGAAGLGALTAIQLTTGSNLDPLGPGQPAPYSSPGDTRPNMILVSADDMRAEEIRFMPRTLKLLGEQGITFKEALTPHPLCCPARAEILTGQFAQNNGVRTNWGPQGGYGPLDASNTIATWMNAAGYNTGMVGKHLNSVKFADGPEPGWTYFDPTLNGYSDYYNFQQYDNGNYTQVDGEYYTDYVSSTTTSAIQTLSSYRAPFFMWVSHFGPHSAQDKGASRGERKTPPVAAPSYFSDPANVEKNERLTNEYFKSVKAKASWREKDKSDKQRYLQKESASGEDVKALMSGRIAALDAVDIAVAKIIEDLTATGELNNTYVGFITDNGYLLGEHDYIGKVLGFEEAFRTPLLMRGPGIEPGSTHGKPVTIVDLAPTWLELGDASANLTLDGRSLVPALQGKPMDLHPGGVLVQAGPVQHETANTGWYFRGVRTERYTYLAYHDGWVELYDRAKDPHQVASVANDPAYAAVRADLADRAQRLASCAGANCNPDFGPIAKPVSRKRR